MARIRTIKPAFFLHADMHEAETETGLPLRLAFIGLWTVADREGRFKWSPKTIKVQVLPFDNVDFSHVLDALATRGFIVKYTKDGKDYGYIPTFKDHQAINGKEAKSVLPEPPINTKDLTRDERVPDASSTGADLSEGEGKGRERKGKEGDTPLSPEKKEGEVLKSLTNPEINPEVIKRVFELMAFYGHKEETKTNYIRSEMFKFFNTLDKDGHLPDYDRAFKKYKTYTEKHPELNKMGFSKWIGTHTNGYFDGQWVTGTYFQEQASAPKVTLKQF